MKKLICILCMLTLTACTAVFNNRQTKINIFNVKSDLANGLNVRNEIVLNDLTENTNKHAALIYESGRVKHTDVLENKIKISQSNNLKGIYLYDEFHCITDAYYDTKNSIDNNEKVITVLLDGFSLAQYNYAKDAGNISFLNKYLKNEAISVYVPVTNSGYGAIITGQTPDKNSIHDRSDREMSAESIFKYAIENKINICLLEGNIKILNTEIEPILHTDTNKDGDTDDEMYESLLASLEKNDFIFVHFHGIDDRGHRYGPYSKETMEYIKKIDGYINDLSALWAGKIIITSDHGMHEEAGTGNHGEMMSSDMVVPYFIIEK